MLNNVFKITQYHVQWNRRGPSRHENLNSNHAPGGMTWGWGRKEKKNVIFWSTEVKEDQWQGKKKKKAIYLFIYLHLMWFLWPIDMPQVIMLRGNNSAKTQATVEGFTSLADIKKNKIVVLSAISLPSCTLCKSNHLKSYILLSIDSNSNKILIMYCNCCITDKCLVNFQCLAIAIKAGWEEWQLIVKFICRLYGIVQSNLTVIHINCKSIISKFD